MSRTAAFALTLFALVLIYPAGSAHAESKSESEWKEIKESHVEWDAAIEKGQPDVTYHKASDSLTYRLEFEQDVALERLVRFFVHTYDYQAAVRFRFGSQTVRGKQVKRVPSSHEGVKWEYIYEVQLVTKRVGTGSIELTTDQVEYGYAEFRFYEYGSETEIVPADLVGTWTLDVEKTASQLAFLNGLTKEDGKRLATKFASSTKGRASLVLKANGRLEIHEGKRIIRGSWRYAQKQLMVKDDKSSARGYVSRDGSRFHIQLPGDKLTVELVYKKI